MTAERSPWSQPETEFTVPGDDHVASTPPGTDPTGREVRNESGSPKPACRSGGVTHLGRSGAGAADEALWQRTSASPSTAKEVDPAIAERKAMRRYLAVAAAIVALGVLAVGVRVVAGLGQPGAGFLEKTFAGPRDTRGDLAKLCPPPTEDSRSQRRDIPPAPPGPRTVDQAAGISYASYGDPWRTWDQVWSGGDLKVTYRVGQHFITEPGPDRNGYHASILSGSVPATVNDALAVDLKCTGQQVAADVRTEYYFQPNTVEQIRDEFATIGGMPAWVSVFRLRFERPGLRAKDELAAVVLLDVGRPEAAILYVSIPGTHHEWDRIVNEVIDSVRPT